MLLLLCITQRIPSRGILLFVTAPSVIAGTCTLGCICYRWCWWWWCCCCACNLPTLAPMCCCATNLVTLAIRTGAFATHVVWVFSDLGERVLVLGLIIMCGLIAHHHAFTFDEASGFRCLCFCCWIQAGWVQDSASISAKLEVTRPLIVGIPSTTVKVHESAAIVT